MVAEHEPLDQLIIDRALAVSAGGVSQSVCRAVINGAVVIYNLDDPPKWLRPILDMRDENGDVVTAQVDCDERDRPMHVTVEYSMDPALDPRTSHAEKAAAGLI
jgi:hypothetical protein